MTDVQIEAGTLTANREERVVTGMLLPFGEVGRTNLGKFSVPGPGIFRMPEDTSTLMANLDHNREHPVATALTATETPAGIVASWRVAKGAQGDQLLAEIDDPSNTEARRSLSIEVADVVLRAGKAVSGRIFGGAFVKAGAFPSATLMAADVGEEPANEPIDPEDPEAETTEESKTNPDGSVTKTTTSTKTEADAEGNTTTVKTVTTLTTEPAAPPANPEGDTVPNAQVPNTLTARKAGDAPKGLSFLGLSRKLAEAKGTGSQSLYAAIAKEEEAASALFAALNDVKYDDGPADAIAAVPQWLGELYSGRAFQRRITPLIGSGALTSFKIAGWRWAVKPEVGPWAGNKTNVPSNTPTTESYEVTARRFAGAHDVAREYRDFNVTEFWDGYFRGMTESYDRQVDQAVLLDLLASATPVTRGTVPTDVSPGMVSIVDGALAILDEGLPSYAIVAKDLYRDILLTRNDDTLAYLNAALGLEEGTITTFKVVPHKDMTAGTALVGAKEAATSHELPGVPIRVEGLDMVKGGIDPGLFGYQGTVIHDEAALALVSPTAPAGA